MYLSWSLIKFSVLHPGLKLEYFRVQKWKTDWIEVAEDLVRDEYARNYEGKEESIQDETNKSDKDTIVSYD